MLLYGGGSAVSGGLLDRVTDSLRQEGIYYIVRGGVKPNPILSFAESVADDCRKENLDFLLAVGGGSVIDTAKSAACSLANPETPLWDFQTGKAKPQRPSRPVGVVLTIAAAGSEGSDSSVLTYDATGEKRGFSSPVNRPVFALMNPEITYSLPKRQTACGVVDIMMHTLERYFSTDVFCETTDALAEALLRTAIHYGPKVMENPTDYEARSEIMWCGTLSHSDLTGLGRPKSFVVHQMGHILSGRFDLPHAESLSCVFCAWAREVYGFGVPRFARYAREVWKISVPDDEKAAIAGIAATEKFFRELHMPVSFGEAEMGVQKDEDVVSMARDCSWGGKRSVGTFHPLDEAGILRVFRASNH